MTRKDEEKLSRICVVGNLCAGASDFAARTAAVLETPVFDVDALLAKLGATPGTSPDIESKLASELIAYEQWIIDPGHDTVALQVYLSSATLVLVLDYPKLLCTAHVGMRSLTGSSATPEGAEKPSVIASVKEVWKTFDDVRTDLFQNLAAHASQAEAVVLESPKQADAWLDEHKRRLQFQAIRSHVTPIA